MGEPSEDRDDPAQGEMDPLSTAMDWFETFTRMAVRSVQDLPDNALFEPFRSGLKVSAVVARTLAKSINDFAANLESVEEGAEQTEDLGPPYVQPHRQNDTETAILFIHGFGQNSASTWGEFPRFLAEDRRLEEWDIYCVGYATSLWIDLAGLWTASPPLNRLSEFLETLADHPPFDNYKSLCIVAHSMGGLVVQRALIDHSGFLARVGDLVLFGTPSNGLYKGELLSFWKRQIHDMADDSPFIKDLRQRWEKEIGDEPPFEFLVVAGDRDEFVPASSSLSPFPKAVQAVVPGSHVTIVNPNNKMDLSVEVVVKQLVGESAPAGPWNSARVAVEKRNFQHAIDTLWPNRDELDDASLVLLALALESVDREEDSIAVLQNTRQETTDVLGVLAGRLKRRWLEEGLLKDAQRAQALYKQALEEAEANGDGAQGFYHAINVAFMDLAFDKNLENARGNARRAIDYCDRSYRDAWCLATYGEAYLVLGEDDSSIDYYRQTLKKSPEVWQISSMYHQATAVAGLLNNQAMDDRLEALFRGDVS